jgi:hypothetical protein
MVGRVFAVLFTVSSLVMKIASELIHEVMGHGFFVLLFGGSISRIHISLLWPYRLSFIRFTPPPSGFTHAQLIWVTAGGIVACLVVSAMTQAWSLRHQGQGPIAMLLFWLGFWTFINPAGYLLVGGIKPFGDVEKLIGLGVLGPWSSFVMGLAVFLLSFLSLSVLLGRLVIRACSVSRTRQLRVLLAAFWALVPVITFASLAGLGWSIMPLPIFLSVLPILVAWALPSALPLAIFGLTEP